ncbi:hypothetical protein ACYF6T_43600 [Streptomyces sp. 7R007]
MSSAPYLVDESAMSEDADVWFAMPPGFVPLPLPDVVEVADGMTERVRPGNALSPLLDAFSDAAAQRRLLTDLGPVARMARLLLGVGAVHCCLGVHADDEGDGRPLLSLFTLASRTTDWASRSVLAARAAAGAENARHIEILDLPCGPASLVQSVLSAPAEAGPSLGRELHQVTAYVPSLDGRRIAILTLATTEVGRVHRYRALLKDIAATVSFDNPLADVSDDVPD